VKGVEWAPTGHRTVDANTAIWTCRGIDGFGENNAVWHVGAGIVAGARIAAAPRHLAVDPNIRHNRQHRRGTRLGAGGVEVEDLAGMVRGSLRYHRKDDWPRRDDSARPLGR